MSGIAGTIWHIFNWQKSRIWNLVFVLAISRKEAKESIYWLRLIKETNQINSHSVLEDLITEATELKKIFSAIIEKSK